MQRNLKKLPLDIGPKLSPDAEFIVSNIKDYALIKEKQGKSWLAKDTRESDFINRFKILTQPSYANNSKASTDVEMLEALRYLYFLVCNRADGEFQKLSPEEESTINSIKDPTEQEEAKKELLWNKFKMNSGKIGNRTNPNWDDFWGKKFTKSQTQAIQVFKKLYLEIATRVFTPYQSHNGEDTYNSMIGKAREMIKEDLQDEHSVISCQCGWFESTTKESVKKLIEECEKEEKKIYETQGEKAFELEMKRPGKA